MSHIHKHYCWFCDKHEQCKQEECDFREEFQIHGHCIARINLIITAHRSLIDQNKGILEQNKRLIDMMEEQKNA